MKCTIELLSPLHIGNGNDLKLVDFYLDERNNRVRFIDFEKFSDHCINEKIDLIKEMQNNVYYTGNDFSITKFMNINKINPSRFISYDVSAIIGKRRRETEFTIKEFIKCGGPYIPGSSIKGAIRTALMWYYLSENKKGKDIVSYGISNWMNKKRITGRDIKRIDDEISRIVFGKDPHNDIFRALKVSDTNIIGLSDLEVSEVKITGNSQSIPVYIENMKINTKGLITSVEIDDVLLHAKTKEINFQSHDLKDYIELKTLLKVCNEFSKRVIEKNLEYLWENYDCYSTVDEFDRLWNEVFKCKENEAILHIGWGGGWYSTTIGLILEELPNFTNYRGGYSNRGNHTGNSIREHFYLGRRPGTNKYSINFPKTRRLTIEGKPLGWVKLSFQQSAPY
ncbi:type III-A CRISPR-associated RAMP protein Csm5 [Methanosarcina barkeri]|uniref:CRISPR system Cms protein Csm5 n=1 Tax=Methanosarcina barkeri CM1 TaxID=796385 RepID=A0A0G3CK45_METBA|nr:type III-A CRISPR-associated RAMP protein Csm5 [Methanosarcina barkeri]AKJ39497.1 CRISPR-associated RAMP protein Csm5 [Methanosarcina barkeri CM1]